MFPFLVFHWINHHVFIFPRCLKQIDWEKTRVCEVRLLKSFQVVSDFILRASQQVARHFTSFRQPQSFWSQPYQIHSNRIGVYTATYCNITSKYIHSNTFFCTVTCSISEHVGPQPSHAVSVLGRGFDRYAVDILEDLCLPSSLRHLAFEGGFNQSFECVKFPESSWAETVLRFLLTTWSLNMFKQYETVMWYRSYIDINANKPQTHVSILYRICICEKKSRP